MCGLKITREKCYWLDNIVLKISLTIIKYQSYLVVLIFFIIIETKVMFKAYPMLLKLSHKM